MLKTIFYSLFLGLFSVCSFAQNCPGYSSVAAGSSEACGNQNYVLTIPNTTCDGQIFFDVDGLYETFGNNVTWTITSNLSGGAVANGNGVAGGTTHVTIGPLDPNIVGNVFTLSATDGTGLGFGTTGGIEVSQGGTVVASISNAGTIIFNANIIISPATITVTTPSGPVTSTANSCNDFIVLIPVQNNNFCDPLNITLPWTITCDVNGSTISSGTASVVVNPQVPSDASDLVDITWDASACAWTVAAQNDCDQLDIGTIFNVSPDPSTLNSGACGNGSENFTVDYLGASGAMNCCSTAGPLVNVTYDSTTTVLSPPQAASSPFGGTNNSALITFPPRGSGGNATSFDLCVDMNNFCFSTTGGDESFYVFIFVDGNQVYMSPQQTGTTFNHCIDLTDISGGYTQSSDVEIYILPNVFTTGGGTVTTFSPNANCGSLSDGEWTADFTSTINVTFDQMEGSAVLCSFPLTSPYTCCTSPPTATNPPPIVVACTSDIPTPDPAVVTGASGTCSTPPTVTFVSDVSDGNTCQGEVVTRTYHVEDACGNGVDVTQQITISAQPPTFTLSSTNPTGCGTSDGQIIIENLTPTTSYNLTYTNNGTPVSSSLITTDGTGNYAITGLGAATYDDFTIALANCSACSTTVNNPIQLNPSTSPLINAGNDTTICAGAQVTLTAFNPSGATISWDNGVTDGVAFTPAVTTTYTVTAGAAGGPTVELLVNGDFENGDVGFTSGLTSSCSCIASSYCIGAEPDSKCNSSMWTNDLWDHTFGTSSGNYMLIDGNSANNNLIWSQSGINVSTGTSYTFSFWVMPEISNGSTQPSFNILINGAVIGTFSTQTLPSQVWANYTTTWNAPSSGAVTLEIRQISPIGGYNDFGIDDVSFTEPSSGTCTSTDNVTVVVTTPPTITITEDTAVCAGSCVQLNATGAVGYTWSAGSTLSDSTIANPMACPINTTTYTVTSGPAGCTSTDDVTVTINPIPTVGAGQDTTICTGEQVTLTASNPNNATISWNNGVTDGIPFAPTVTTTYTVTAAISGCTSTDMITVTIEQIPTVNAGQDIQICAGAQISLSATGTPPYQWDNGVVDGQAFTPPNGSTTYTVTSSSPSGCTGSDQVVVTVGGGAQASFVASSLTGCAPLEVAFTNTSTTSGNCTYIIENLSTETQCNPVVTFNQAGCYDVTLIFSNSSGCTDTVVKTDLICVEQTPEADFVADPNTIGGTIDEVNFNNESEGGDLFYWMFGDGQSSDALNPAHQYELDKDQFVVTLIASTDFGCADTATSVVFVKDELVFYVPNSFTPDNNKFNEVFKPIFTSGFDPYNFTLIIFDRWGETMFESHNANVGWDGTFGGKIVPDGVYIWKIDFKRSDSDEKVTKTGHVNVLK